MAACSRDGSTVDRGTDPGNLLMPGPGGLDISPSTTNWWDCEQWCQRLEQDCLVACPNEGLTAALCALKCEAKYANCTTYCALTY